MSGGISGDPILLIGDGESERRFNVLITGDGFANTTSDQQLLEAHAAAFVEILQQENWFQVLGSAINVYRLNIWSEDSGVTRPVVDQQGNCTGQFDAKNTYFEANYPCDENGSVEYPEINAETIAALHEQPEVLELPLVVHIIGIVLNTDWGLGWAQNNYFVLGGGDWPVVALHEFAHAAFGVGDEYDMAGAYLGAELGYPNLTTETSLNTLKWSHFIFPSVPTPALQNPNVQIPTLENPDDQNCPEYVLPNPLGDDFQIGLFEGGFYKSCRVYRPAYKCKMGSDERDPMCRVCIDAGRTILSPYAPQVPTPHCDVITSDRTLRLDFGEVPLGETTYRSFDIRNTRDGWPAPLYVGLSGQVQSESGSSEGALLSVQRIRFSVDAPGTVQATLTWERSPEVIRHRGHIAAASTDGTPAQVEIPMEIIGNRDLSATLDLFADDADLDLELRDSSDTTVATAGNGTSESLLFSNPALGTYKLVVTNNSQIETDFRLGMAADFRPLLRAILRDQNGVTVATFSSATSPATLSYDVLPGEYTFELENNFWSVSSYQLDFSYPKSDSHLQDSNFGFDPGTETTFIVPAPVIDDAWSRRVFVGFTAPETPGESSTTLDIYTNDPAISHIQLELRGTAVNPPPLDSVLVIDHSGSMSEPTGIPDVSKIQMAASAGKLFVSLLRDTDRVGIVQFNQASDDPADVLLDMTTASLQGKADADRAIEAIAQPTGTTSIGAGIIRGSTVLDQGNVVDHRALLVLTDGIQNTDPDIEAAQALVITKRPAQNVFAIGFGLNRLESTLAEIGTATEGWAQITGQLAGWKEFILQKLYVQILADATDQTIVKDPREVVLAGETRSTDIHLTQFDHSADFIVLFRPAKLLPRQARVMLETPSGDLVRWGDPARLPGIEIIEGESHVCFRVRRLGKKETHGLWRVWVENMSRPSGRSSFKDAVVYAVMCTARSDLRLGGHVEQLSVNRGNPLSVVFEPILSGRSYQPSAPAFAFVQPPSGSIERIDLFPTAGGHLRGLIENTKKRGPYLIWTELHFQAPHRMTTTRFRQVCGLVLARKPKKV